MFTIFVKAILNSVAWSMLRISLTGSLLTTDDKIHYFNYNISFFPIFLLHASTLFVLISSSLFISGSFSLFLCPCLSSISQRKTKKLIKKKSQNIPFKLFNVFKCVWGLDVGSWTGGGVLWFSSFSDLYMLCTVSNSFSMFIM